MESGKSGRVIAIEKTLARTSLQTIKEVKKYASKNSAYR
ncbi:hypothetical protein CAter282_0050 [Collimonas arenae]|uniref:Uncharacterized protein n=1 Tax=Collimonas arenae TaxID=279058 RepID=A0A127QCX6_9BURK|nr:hypothetical protein CAter10_0052 [Collimonas arenae]AMP07874.1 hypothetical protein CAter282_0050 [Collimonas arenae]